MRFNWNLTKTQFGIVLEYFRSLRKKWRIGKVRRKKKLEVKGRRVSPRVKRQVSGSEQKEFLAERWVFIPRGVT